MSHFDSCRRALSVVLVVACLLLVPGIATAKFTGARSSGLSVSTDTMETPVAVTGTFSCSSPGTQEAVAINVTGFTDTGPVGASYTYEVLLAGVVQTSASTSSHVQALTTSRVDDKTSTTWTLRIRSVLGPWTGTAYTRSITCVRKSSNSGTL